MTLLLHASALDARRAVARGALSPLATGLRAELEPLLAGSHEVPRGKALLSRAGGRCARDGTLLAYDPLDARHRCAACGREHAGEEHDRFRLYWHHLWLAERAVHGALLGILLDDAACTALAADLVAGYADAYLDFPNRDNVLGPSRPFFSTYLESIWLLQLAVALDLLEAGDAHGSRRALGGRVRERLIEPSARLIASYDEGMSNRQVWNNAALLAAGRLLGDDGLVDRALHGASGIQAHLGTALLSDGSWYEGENYHLFAHRGLWYGVQLAEAAGHALPAAMADRFREGFAAPFRTVLPDLTYPSRRDSQYAVSVRQPRVAESCELGLARTDDARLVGMLARLYDPAVPRRGTGRAASSADVERNVPATGLSRADLSWRALLLARDALPPLAPLPLRSDLLPAQGIAILRRGGGARYVALDYGHSGGGHGHPDRLNLLLMDGATRWFDDPGTGSYVDRSLHWYRSTLAHTAPLVDGRSQPRVHGTLVAFDDGDAAGWVCAEAALAPGLRVRRTVVLRDDYLVDVMEWEGDRAHELALPLHGMALVDSAGESLGATPAPIVGGSDVEDGFDFLERTSRVEAGDGSSVRVLGTRAPGDAPPARLDGWITAVPGTTWWSADAPRPPGQDGLAPMVLARCRGRRGRIAAVWSWRAAVTAVDAGTDAIVVTRRDGSVERHARSAAGWEVEIVRGGARERVRLAGIAEEAESPGDVGAPPVGDPGALETPPSPASLPARFELGAPHYRGSEESWEDAGRPGATVALSVTAGRELLVAVTVEPSHRIFVAEGTVNRLDNEPAEINGDGVQLYVRCGSATAHVAPGASSTGSAWLLVPRGDDRVVIAKPIGGFGDHLSVEASWAPTSSGYRLEARVPLPPGCTILALDVLVNEIGPGRARRRGQLVLSGARGEFVYLRGDRHEPHRLLRFLVPHA